MVCTLSHLKDERLEFLVVALESTSNYDVNKCSVKGLWHHKYTGQGLYERAAAALCENEVKSTPLQACQVCFLSFSCID